MNIAKVAFLSLAIFSASAIGAAISSNPENQGFGYNQQNGAYEQPYETRGRGVDQYSSGKELQQGQYRGQQEMQQQGQYRSQQEMQQHRGGQQMQPQDNVDYSQYDRLSPSDKMSQFLSGDTPYQRENPVPGQYPQSNQQNQNQMDQMNQMNQMDQRRLSNYQNQNYNNNNQMANNYQVDSYSQYHGGYGAGSNQVYSENSHQPYGYYQPQGGNQSFEGQSYSAPSYSGGGGCANGRCGSPW